ncbi:MAG: YbjQ family protein [Oscillospiraceae bacterium]|nr:YbjQ family protein [Oscillospiraceae bacterium]
MFFITTTSAIQDKKIVQYLGIASGEGSDYLWIGVPSAKLASDTKDIMKKIKRQALDELTRHAESMGANAVLDVQFSFTSLSQEGTGELLASASGTAVVVE